MEKDKIINKIENNIFMAEIMLKNAMNSLHSGNVNESYRNYTNGRIKEIEKKINEYKLLLHFIMK